MWDQNKQQMSSSYGSQGQAMEMDQGLRKFMMGVYNYMASALILTGLVAWFVAQNAVVMEAGQIVGLTELGNALYNSPLKWVVMLSPFAILLFGFRPSMSVGAQQAMFWGFATLMGLSLSSIFLVYTGSSIARVFFITSATFGAMSLYGYTTKKDLSGWGSFLFMGLIGVIIASVVNIFLQSTMLQFVVSIAGVGVFVGLTAYDTQKLKRIYYQVAGHGEMMAKATISGALSLYLDFINLFVMLMQLLGDRR